MFIVRPPHRATALKKANYLALMSLIGVSRQISSYQASTTITTCKFTSVSLVGENDFSSFLIRNELHFEAKQMKKKKSSFTLHGSMAAESASRSPLIPGQWTVSRSKITLRTAYQRRVHLGY
jgi:hypothetical protein